MASAILLCLAIVLVLTYRACRTRNGWREDFRMNGHPWCWVADGRGDYQAADLIVDALATHGIRSIDEGKFQYFCIGVRLENANKAARIVREIIPTLRDTKVRVRDEQGNWPEWKLDD